MATYYIDPNADAGGDGTTTALTGANAAFNSWERSATGGPITYATGNTYLGKGGETWVSPSEGFDGGFVAAGNLTIGSYGTGRHILDCRASTKERSFLSFGPDNVIQDIHIIGSINGNGTTAHIIATSTTGTGGVTIDNCLLEIIGKSDAREAKAVSHGGGYPVNITDCEIRGMSKGIDCRFTTVADGTTDSFLISNNTIYDFVYDSALSANATGIQMYSSTDGYNFGYLGIIEGNNISEWGGFAIVSTVNEVIIRDNELGPCTRSDQDSTASAAILTGTPTSEVANGNSAFKIYKNYIHDCNHPTTFNAAYVMRGNFNTDFYANIIDNVDIVAYTSYSWQTNNRIFNNYIANVDGGNGDTCIRQQDDSASDAGDYMSVYNNIFVDITSTYLFVVQTNTSEIYTGNNLTDDTYTSLEASGGSIVDAGGNVTGDPLLEDYKPTKDSPCYQAGTFVSFSARDYNGRPFHTPPTIGAYEFTSGFPAQTRTVATRVAASTRTAATTRTAR